MTEAGLAPMQILTAATVGGAKVMGQKDQLGTIQEGKFADMVILNSEPWTDILNTSDIHLVVKNGTVYKPKQIIKKIPEDIVQQQVNAYKARDLEAFLATYSPDIKIFNHPDSLLYSGLEEIKSVYESLFEHAPNLHVQIVNRISLGKFVIDREKSRVTSNMPWLFTKYKMI